MARLLPFRPLNPLAPRTPRLVELDDEAAEAVFAALSAETARAILGRLYDGPGTATDVAEAADTSLQNARYHLEKLQAADLVEAVDTWYSSRGTEMTVYAPTNEPLVVAAGPEEQTTVLRSALGRLVGALALLGVVSLLLGRLAPRRLVSTAAGGGSAGGGSANNPAMAATATREAAAGIQAVNATPAPAVKSVPHTAAAQAGGLLAPGGGLPPGALVFLGGVVVLAVVAGWWYWRRYRPLYG